MTEDIAEFQQTVPSGGRVHIVVQSSLGHLEPGCEIGQIRPVLLVVLGIVLSREIIISVNTGCGSELQQGRAHVQSQEILCLPDISGK